MIENKMLVTHTSRTGKTYLLHSGPKRDGGVQHFFSTRATGNLADRLPEGFEIYEAVGGQVFLRREQPKLIRDSERDIVSQWLQQNHPRHRYKIEVRAKTLTIHENGNPIEASERFGRIFSRQDLADMAGRFASYQAVLRFILTDPVRRLFAPERFCFRGSVDDWISVGPPESIDKIAAKHLKHLGRNSLFELY